MSLSSTRRDFLQTTATVAASVTFGRAALAETLPGAVNATPEDPGIRAFEDRMLRAKPVPLDKVRVTGGPLKNAQDLTAAYLLSLDPNRMMAYYRVRAGLQQKAEPYSGWDGEGRQLTGHIAGHHLSAVSYMYLATGDARFKERADVLVREMKEVQDKYGDGYLGAIITAPGQNGAPPKDGRQVFTDVSKGEIRSGGFDLNGLWSPWYTLHKTFAGLRDAYRFTGNKTALDVELKFAKWAEGILAPMSDEQVQKMLATEHGGMNEVLADLYADTGDKRWLNLSVRFEHHAFTDPLKRHQDNLSGKHGNCQIPKLVGSAARFGYTGDTQDIVAASFFWDRVAQHHSYSTGGHGLDEYFGPPDQLSPRVDGRTCESCNVYNMLKLTKRLFSLKPDPAYADFHERALFNHVLGSIDNTDGRTSYMVPVGRAEMQEYQDMQRSFTCCVGTGMENHALHGYGVYYESDDTVWVNIFVPSTAQLALGNAKLTMETGFPDGDDAKLTVALPSPKEFTLAIRRPVWAGDNFAVKVNGTPVPQPPIASFRENGAGGRANAPGNEASRQSSVFVNLKRTWKTGDTIEVSIPKSLRLEPTPDNKSVATIMWGPLVLAGDLAPRPEGRGGGGGGRGGAQGPAVPLIVTADKPVDQWVVPAGGKPGDFKVQQAARTLQQPSSLIDVPLTPFHRTHRRIYSLYFDVLTQNEFDSRVASIAAERERVRKLDAATVGSVVIGNPQAERDRNYQSEPDRQVTRTGGRSGRGGPGSFSYELPVEATQLALVVTYLNPIGQDPADGNFVIQVDGTDVAHFARNATPTGFYDATYSIPAALTQGKTKVTVRFQAASGGRIAVVYGLRAVRVKDL